jgi:hypothetical protein
MNVYMTAFGYELLVALEELVEYFDDGNGENVCVGTITQSELAEFRALIARGKGEWRGASRANERREERRRMTYRATTGGDKGRVLGASACGPALRAPLHRRSTARGREGVETNPGEHPDEHPQFRNCTEGNPAL